MMRVTDNSIFKFWEIGESERIHPKDEEVFKRVSEKGHRLKLQCLPCPILGKLKTAPVVLLFLSPGYNRKDLIDAKMTSGRKYYARRRSGTEPLRDGTPGTEWLRNIVKHL